jgi:hypothetical protein
MWWRKRRAARRAAEQAAWDGAVGRHRLRDGDVVPLANGKRWVDYMTQPLPVIDPPILNRAGEHRTGVRKWLR